MTVITVKENGGEHPGEEAVEAVIPAGHNDVSININTNSTSNNDNNKNNNSNNPDAAAATAKATAAANANAGHQRRPSLAAPITDSRFGGLAGVVEQSMRSSLGQQLGSLSAPFPVTATELGNLSNERTRAALADLLEKGIQTHVRYDKETDHLFDADDAGGMMQDPERPSPQHKLLQDVMQLVQRIREAGEVDHDHDDDHKVVDPDAQTNADMATDVLTNILLRSSPESGIDPREVEHRIAVFGSNALTEKKLDSFLKLCWEAVQDFVLIMLIVLGVISIVVEMTTHPGCTTCWIEGAAILCSVCIVVIVTAGIDYAKQFAFIRLSKSLHETNTKSVIRDGKQVSVIDDEIVVGDILSVNSHNLASIPADCVLLGPPADLKMNESSLTGESKLISKRPGDIILSGTNAVQGSGKMVVIAVGINSVAGRIKARVYESEDHEDELGGDDDNSPLFVKLDTIAKRIGMAGTAAALLAFAGSCIIGLAINGDDAEHIIDYLVTAITVLAVAVPEGLPLAVTLSLAFSSNKMMRDMNLVKHLDACETMGCATTICTDKTGTLYILVYTCAFSPDIV